MKKTEKTRIVILSVVVLAVIAFLAYMYSVNLLPLGAYYQKGSITISNGTASLNRSVWLAESQTQLTTGMMWRQDFGGAYGMLFVFPAQQPLCFWMENTVIPLEQAWINGSGYVTAVYEAPALNTTPICAPGKYVLELPANASLSVGSRIVLSR